MGEQDAQGINFLGLNLILVGVVVLAAFGFLVAMMRKRWKQGFLHKGEPPGRP